MKKLIQLLTKPLHRPAFVFFQLCFLCIIVYVGFLPHDNTSFDNEACIYLADNWTYEATDGSASTITLPADVAPNMENGVRISNTLPSESKTSITAIGKLCVFQNYKIYIDSELFYDSTDSELSARSFDKAPGTFWSLLTLPSDFAGKEITLEITSPYADYQGKISSVLLGTKSSIIYELIRSNFLKLILSILLFISGICFIIFSFIIGREMINGETIRFLGWFQLWSGLWIFSESNVTQLIISNAVLTNTLAFASIQMLLISFLEYFRLLPHLHWKRLQKCALYLLYTEVFISMALQVSGIYDFYETLFVFLFIMVSVILFTLIQIFVEVFYYKNNSLNYMLYCFVILGFCGLLEIYKFYFITRVHLGLFFIVGLVFSIFIISFVETRKAYQMIKLGKEAKYYEHLATVDFMTGCCNRAALQKDLDQHNQELHSQKLAAAIVCDVNNLKTINDHFGHGAGDNAIKVCSHLLQSTFTHIGNCYRTGGDEFTCLIYDLDEHNLKQLLNHFSETCKSTIIDSDHKLSAAVGYAYFDSAKDSSLENVIRRADENMYRMKRDMKASF